MERDPETAERLQLMARVQAQMVRVVEQLSAWNDYHADRELPPDLRRHVPRPEHALEYLTTYRAQLADELRELADSSVDWRDALRPDPRWRRN